MIFGYVRVSTAKEDQQKSLQHQKELLQEMYKDYEVLMYSNTGSVQALIEKGLRSYYMIQD